MRAALEEEFEAIAREAIESAEAVKCDFSDFVEGLKSIEIEIRERRSMAEEELRHLNGD